jgi:hypothetical protein
VEWNSLNLAVIKKSFIYHTPKPIASVKHLTVTNTRQDKNNNTDRLYSKAIELQTSSSSLPQFHNNHQPCRTPTIPEIHGKSLYSRPIIQLTLSPYVILNDFGGAFAMGAIGGGIWHGIKGARNSPRGERLVGSLSAIKARAPVLGGNFGVWGGLFSSYDCAVKGYRQKEDPWNAITAGFMTGGTLAFRCKSLSPRIRRSIAIRGFRQEERGTDAQELRRET